jgi:hypothetical protein
MKFVVAGILLKAKNADLRGRQRFATALKIGMLD